MNEIKIFENQKFGQIRAVEIEKKPMFVASDIAKSTRLCDSKQSGTDTLQSGFQNGR